MGRLRLSAFTCPVSNRPVEQDNMCVGIYSLAQLFRLNGQDMHSFASLQQASWTGCADCSACVCVCGGGGCRLRGSGGGVGGRANRERKQSKVATAVLLFAQRGTYGEPAGSMRCLTARSQRRNSTAKEGRFQIGRTE